jgi:glycosyltransferase 2 family protein
MLGSIAIGVKLPSLTVTKRQVVFLLAKFLFAAAVLTWLFHKVDMNRVFDTLISAGRGEIAGGVLLCLCMVAIAGWRWHRWLGVFQIDMPLGALICIAQIGQFFMMFLPGPTGDDLTRMLYISRLAPGRVGEACTTVLLDRCMGLASVLMLSVACIPWQWSVLSTSSETHWLALIILSGGAAVSLLTAVFFWVGHPTHLWFEKRLRSLPAHSLRDEAARIWGLLCANKRSIAQIGCAALATQLLSCVLFYLAGRSVGIHVSLFVWLTFVPIVLAANALPITFAGLGVREYLLVLFLGVTAHVDGERALAASFVAFSMILILSLLGGALYIFYKPKPKSARLDQETEPGT